MTAYKGTTIAGFPNLFQIVGPNTGLGHSSMVFIIESQIAYIRLGAAADGRARASPPSSRRQEAQDAWNADVQRRMKRTVWSTGGCASWYLDAHGRNTTLWPRTTFKFRELLSTFDLDQYVVTARDDRHHDEGARSMKTLDNKVVVITGAGSGMGREMALIAARQGALLAVSDWNEQGLAETVDLLKAAGARELRSDVVDVSDRAAVAALAERRRPAVRPGQHGRQQRRRHRHRRLRGDGLRGLRLDRRRQLHGRRQRHQGVPAPPDRLRRRRLVNISSLFGLISMPGQTAYNATKYAVRGFTEALREEMLINGHPSPSPASTPAASRPASPATAARPPARTPPRSTRSSRRSWPG